MAPAQRQDRPYHHGNLRAELIEASFDLLAEHGLGDFSVAKVARAVGVSTASPYRHFGGFSGLHVEPDAGAVS